MRFQKGHVPWDKGKVLPEWVRQKLRRGKRIEKQCPFCKSKFESLDCLKRTYCSKNCYLMEIKKMDEKLCKQCGKPIRRRQANELKNAVFCGLKCKFDYQRLHPPHSFGKMETRKCQICGKEFRSNRPKRKYCSDLCRHKGQSIIMTGRSFVNGNYKSTASFRNSIRSHFVDKCAICGWDQAANDVCHIIPEKMGGKHLPENIIMLCPNDHRLFDQGKISMDEIIKARPNCLKSNNI